MLKDKFAAFGLLTVMWLGPGGMECPAQNFMNIVHGRFYYQPGTSLQSSETQVQITDWRIETVLPVELASGNVFGIKPQWKRIALGSGNENLRDLSLYSLKAPVFAFIKLGESPWSMYADISPKLNSDFKNVGARHFQIGGMFIFYRERKKDFYWQFGLFYNQDTYGPFFMPLIGLDWKMDDRNYLSFLLPAYIIYERKLGNKLYAGAEVELSGETYRLGGSAEENSFISQLGEDKMTFLTEPHLFLDYHVMKHLVLYVKPGFRLFQKYEHYTESDERIPDSEYVNGTLKNNFYLETGIALRYRYDEE